MRIVFCASQTEPAPWLKALEARLPEAQVVNFDPADSTQADYAVVWAPGTRLFDSQTRLRAVFNLGAGVDALVALPNLPAGMPVIRLDDAGMAVQMAEYVCQAVIRHAREFDVFEADMHNRLWRSRKPTVRSRFPVGVMGLGAIGRRVALALAGFDYPVLGWSRLPKSIPGVRSFTGEAGLDAFLRASRILVCVLPLTPDTESILNHANLSKLLPEGLVINVARGAHLVDDDLLALLDAGSLRAAVLDVFREEPLPANHPFWGHPKIVMTPHIAARTHREDSIDQIAGKIRSLERGEPIAGIVDRDRGY